MLTNSEYADFDRTRRLHARAVRDSIALVRRVTPEDIPRPTPSPNAATGLPHGAAVRDMTC
ncbi:hypothetical protein J7E96_21260 [Streptomyces sp. ISL-96]|uniref:hypothetical protein n=1 Tax=Streptomyces sp. ISL-96 TaxID=2819191 RepID=UPI001BE79080|nr:hypothetical protein [Streptomyces sp. ISL-96]MBT2490999.1 hypothetical protein [Streptomyces sp. ISL-96]